MIPILHLLGVSPPNPFSPSSLSQAPKLPSQEPQTTELWNLPCWLFSGGALWTEGRLRGRGKGSCNQEQPTKREAPD